MDSIGPLCFEAQVLVVVLVSDHPHPSIAISFGDP